MVRLSHRSKLISIVVLVLLLAGGVYAWHRHGAVPRAETTSKEPSAQSNFTGGKGHQSNPSANTNQGGATDNHGDSSTNSGATGTASSSGVVTVTSPASDALLSSGDTLRGTATGQSKVQYRLIDDTVGVIAQGSLDVVDGRYSGTLQFTAHAKTGRLDVFTYDSQFQETNEVQLPVELGG